jgi:hypothetical protein
MKSVLVTYFHEHAGWFVFGAWLFCLITVFAGYRFGALTIIGDAYGDPQLVYPIRKTLLFVIAVAVVTSLIVAILASISLSAGHRVLASALVAAINSILNVGATVALILSPRGPQEIFDRYVGKQRYLLPRHNKPPNEATVAAGIGFDFVTCLMPFGERDRSRCQSGTLVSVRPREVGLMNWKDVSYWSENWRDMERLDEVMDHEAYVGGWYDLFSKSERRDIPTPYYVRHDDAGRLMRLVRCYGSQGPCERYTVVGDYALYYRTDKSALSQWREIDDRLLQLIDSWRAPNQPAQ